MVLVVAEVVVSLVDAVVVVTAGAVKSKLFYIKTLRKAKAN